MQNPFLGIRKKNPDIKRFINQDILTGNIGNSASLNRYSYVEGNPVSYTDPFGLSLFDYFTDKINVSSSKLAIKGGRLSSAAAEVLSTLNTMDMLACVYYAASDFGNDIAYLIYKYGYEKAEFSADTWVEMLSLTAHGIQLGHYSNPFMDTDLTPYFEEAISELNQNKGFINFASGESGKKTLLESTPEEIAKMTRTELQESLPEGWDFQEHNGRIHIKDERGNYRVRIDPPDKNTNYTHIHIKDELLAVCLTSKGEATISP